MDYSRLFAAAEQAHNIHHEVYDKYPADRLMHDIALALMAVQTQTTEVLDTFPTIPVTQEADQILKEIGQEP